MPLGCFSDRVQASTPVLGQSPVTTIDRLTGGYTITIQVAPSIALNCGDSVQGLQVWRAGDRSCLTVGDFELDCPQCFRAHVSVRQPLSPCIGDPTLAGVPAWRLAGILQRTGLVSRLGHKPEENIRRRDCPEYWPTHYLSSSSNESNS